MTFVGQKWQFVTLGYYIPRTTMHFQSTPIVGYYTCKPILNLNPNAIDLELERNQLLALLESTKKM
jgi:hypothetical protein